MLSKKYLDRALKLDRERDRKREQRRKEAEEEHRIHEAEDQKRLELEKARRRGDGVSEGKVRRGVNTSAASEEVGGGGYILLFAFYRFSHSLARWRLTVVRSALRESTRSTDESFSGKAQ